MARIRSVKPEYWLDRKMARGASRDARLLYIGLWNYADEHGRLHGDPAVIKGQVFPYDDVDVAVLLDELVGLRRVQAYEHDGDPYLFLPKLAAHQRLEAVKVPSRLPEPPDPSEVPPSPRSNGKSAPRTDKSAPRTDSTETNCALQVAGSREQVAGSRGQRAAPSADNAQPIVDAYVRGARAAGLPDPDGSLCARVGKQAKGMLAAHDPVALARAAFNMGANGWHDLAVQVQRDAASARGQPNKASQRTEANLAVVARLAEQERGA